MQEKKKDKLIWWVKCPHCGLELHIADLGWEVVEKGQKVYVSCPDCGTYIKKIVGKDLVGWLNQNVKVLLFQLSKKLKEGGVNFLV